MERGPMSFDAGVAAGRVGRNSGRGFHEYA